MEKLYKTFDGACWPLANKRLGEIHDKLSYSNEEALTIKDRLLTASILCAYVELITCSKKKRDYVIRNLKKEYKIRCLNEE